MLPLTRNVEEAEVRNNADSLIYQAERTIKDLGDKADKALVEKVQKAIDKLKEELKGQDIERIKAATEELTKPLYELSAAAYQAASGGNAAGADQGKGPKDDNVVDADYKVVDDDKK